MNGLLQCVNKWFKCVITLKMEPSPGANLDGVNGNSHKLLNVFLLVDVMMMRQEQLLQLVHQMIHVGCSMNLVMKVLNLLIIVLVLIWIIVFSILVPMINVTGIMKWCFGTWLWLIKMVMEQLLMMSVMKYMILNLKECVIQWSMNVMLTEMAVWTCVNSESVYTKWKVLDTVHRCVLSHILIWLITNMPWV